jgi:hypothetical protein
MDWMTSEVVSIVYYLMPGFLAAWVFYTLTAHRKTTPFERIVEALVFTVVVQAITFVVRWVLLLFGRLVHVGAWTEESTLVWSVLLALAVGSAVAWFANGDYFHSCLRNLGITTRTSFPSQWFSAFHAQKRWVILHLSGGRRLYGWPEEWPDHPDIGHFVIDQPEWLLEDGRRAPLYRVEKMLVPANDVELVEFLKYDEEVTEPKEADEVQSMLEQLHKKEEVNHGS